MDGLCMHVSQVLNALRQPMTITCTSYLGHCAAYPPPCLLGHACLLPCCAYWHAFSGRMGMK